MDYNISEWKVITQDPKSIKKDIKIKLSIDHYDTTMPYYVWSSSSNSQSELSELSPSSPAANHLWHGAASGCLLRVLSLNHKALAILAFLITSSSLARCLSFATSSQIIMRLLFSASCVFPSLKSWSSLSKEEIVESFSMVYFSRTAFYAFKSNIVWLRRPKCLRIPSKAILVTYLRANIWKEKQSIREIPWNKIFPDKK